jgi:hypothetical protein
MVDFSSSVGITHSRLTSLRIELDSHTGTCAAGKNILVIHEHPIVGMVSGLTPHSQLARQRLWMLTSGTSAMIQRAT